MEFWLATANVKEAEDLLAYGIFEGIITNPTIVVKEKCNPVEVFTKLSKVANVLYYQIGHNTVDKMMEEADKMLSIAPDKMRIKVPATKEGLSVIRKLSGQGQTVMATIVPTAPWMMLALAAGAKAIAPYSRMIQQAGISSKIEEILNMQQIIDMQHINVEICTGLYSATDMSFYASYGIKSGFIFPDDARNFLEQPLVEDAASVYNPDLTILHSFH